MTHELKILNIDILDLDPENPRLPSYVDRDQQSMISFLAQSSSIEELMSAIAENDFFPAESLIAIPGENSRYIVVEGNRRLTALRLLSGENYPDISERIKRIREEAKYRPSKVPVSIFPTRKYILNYLGNRHIAGVKSWGALAKARYISQLYENTNQEGEFSERCREVAKIIGSRRDFIEKTMRAYNIYEISQQNNFFNIDNVDESTIKFSLISTAINYEGIHDFLYNEQKKPKKDNIKEFFIWLFSRGKDNKTKLGESRQLSKLSKILLNKEALDAFRKGASIEQAWLKTNAIEEDFDSLCFNIHQNLSEANALAADVESDESRTKITTSIFKQARALKKSMETDDD